MAVCQAERDRCLALLVNSYRGGGWFGIFVGAAGGYDGREGGVSGRTLSQPRAARQLLQGNGFIV
jgi:hypothetical protein